MEATELGRFYYDKVTGFKGVATARCEYIDGPPQVRLEARVSDDDEHRDLWIAESRLLRVSDAEPVKL